MTRVRLYLGAAAAMLALLVPCVWQPRIYAGDLSSHIYNAWLATLVERAQAPGLVIRPMTTNILFDLLLEALFKWFGAAWAQRIAVGIVVCVFAGGLFAYLRAVSGRRPWFLLPVIAMLSYGWVFHMGFFNFLLSLGLSLLALSLAWRPRPASLVAACALLAVAYISHCVPVVWALALAAYRQVCLAVRPRWRVALLTASIGLVAAARFVLTVRYRTHWSASQFTYVTGADQFWFSGDATSLCAVLMLAAWIILLVRRMHSRSPLRILLGFDAQSVLLHVLAVMLLPNEVYLPIYKWGFTFIAGRLSLLLAISLCGLLAAARPRLPEMVLMTAAGIWFFGWMYVETGTFSRLEDRMTDLVKTLPASARIVAPLHESRRAPQLTHMADRVCVAQCISYANYEPLTAQFRIQVDDVHPAARPLVARDYATSAALESGKHHPQPGDPDYYQIDFCSGVQELCVTYVNSSGRPD